MERRLYSELLVWKEASRRKPLVLRGARQTGKTFLLKEFGKREYQRTAYFDFEQDPGLDSFFQRDLDPGRILKELSIYRGVKLRPETDLIIFDEIQASNSALNSLKYFREQAAGYHLVAAGSLLGISLSERASFPVGKVSFLNLFPMSFSEYLTAAGLSDYLGFLEGPPAPLPDAIHTDLIDQLRRYFVVGGMPEVVEHCLETDDPRDIRKLQRDILDAYILDFAKHAPGSDIPKLRIIWDSLPRQLGRENRKFMFSVARQGARAREYENALRWLDDAGLIHLCRMVSTPRLPLDHYSDQSAFKVYALDVGLLGAMAGADPNQLLQGGRAFTEYRGALTENYVAQELLAAGHRDLYYWRSTGGKAEVDFLCELEGKVIPIEVKAGLNRKSKSLKSFAQQYDPKELLRCNLLNLKRDGRICNIPLYAISRMRHFGC